MIQYKIKLGGGEDMPEEKWSLTGELIEACGSPPICPAYFLSPFPKGYCEGVITFNITEGKFGDVNLGGFKGATAFTTPKGKTITEGLGEWKAIVYLDEKANDKQARALETIMTTVFGGFGQVLKVKRAKINFIKELVNKGPAAKHTVEIPGIFLLKAEPLVDREGKPTKVVNSPLFGGVIYVGVSEINEFKDSDLDRTWKYQGMSCTYYNYRLDSETLMITPISK
jgi:hypothetical protein